MNNDLISRSALIERYGEPCHSFLDIIESMPAVDAVPMDFHERCLLLEVQKRHAVERERDAAVEAAKVKPFTWEEAIQDDCFLEIKDDEYIDAALNIFASSHDEFDEEDHISYLTNDTPEDEILILYRGDYNRKWRCWPRRPTGEERAAAKWEVE